VFTGDLQLFAVPDLLEFLKSSRRTGTLVVTSESGIGAVHLRDGMLTGAASPRCTNIGDLLITQGAINQDELRMATIAQEVDSPDRLLGELLVELGSVDAGTVKGALRKQVFLAVKEMVQWTVGRFAFEPDKRSHEQARSGVEIELDTQAVLLDVLRQVDEENM
jgi:hypothetical protein